MFPLLFSFGSLYIYSQSVALVIAWIAFSFIFWRILRKDAVDEDRIFDMTFYMTIAAVIFARIGFVSTHWSIFSGKSPLLLAAMWVSPGQSWFMGLIGAILVMVFLAKFYKIRVGLVLDGVAQALPVAIIMGTLGSFLDGSLAGNIAVGLPWAMEYANKPELRHPIQLYEMIAVLGISFVVMHLATIGARKKWAFGLLGAWFFLLYSGVIFVLEFFKESHVYLWQISANQWILIGIFAESLGILYVQGGGRQYIKKLGATLYASISKRYARRDQKTS